MERFGYNEAEKAAKYIQRVVKNHGYDPENIKDGLILGSGLGSFAKEYLNDEGHSGRQPVVITFDEVFRSFGLWEGEKEGVPGHAKKLIIGPLKDESPDNLVVAQSGREHPYEGVHPTRAVFWIRIMQLLGVKTLLGSNAAGILTPNTLDVPSLMLVHSDKDFGGDSPLVGPHEPLYGPRFPHLVDLYTGNRRKKIKGIAKEMGVELKEGTYMRSMGPNYESPDEVYRMRGLLELMWKQGAKQKGEDRFKGSPVGVAGMSSTYEALTAKHATQSGYHPAFTEGISYVSVATNYAASLGPDGLQAPSTHEEVQENSLKVQKHFGNLVREVLISGRR